MIDQQTFQQYLSEILGDLELRTTDSRYYVRPNSPQFRSEVSISAMEYEHLRGLQKKDIIGNQRLQSLYESLISYHEARSDTVNIFNLALGNVSKVVRSHMRANIGELILRAWKSRELIRQKAREV